jgi:exodeoxyribonuclease VII large subunit
MLNDSPKSDKIYSVGELNARVDGLLKSSVGPVWVRGEVSGLRPSGAGHVYFSLKDAQGVLSVAFFKFAAAKSTVKLTEGKQILVFGEVGIYQERGSYQMVAQFILDEGAGKLAQEFERLKKMLAAEGLFASERKIALPRLPQVVAFVTSPTGAVWQDFTRILRRRDWRGRVILFPTRVQGEGAESEIAAALAKADSWPSVELIVVGRGGGSLEDLWSFNTEAVVRAVAACERPVISAVGHETDFTLCDFAADVRAETPSAAAEMIAAEFNAAREAVGQTHGRLRQLSAAAMERLGGRLAESRARLEVVSPRSRMQALAVRLDDIADRANRASALAFERARTKFRHAATTLKTYDPHATLERGYAILEDGSGKLLTRAAMVPASGELRAQMADGTVVVRGK